MTAGQNFQATDASAFYGFNWPAARKDVNPVSAPLAGHSVAMQTITAANPNLNQVPRWDFTVTGKFFYATLIFGWGINGGGTALYNGTTIYDYIVESAPAGET